MKTKLLISIILVVLLTSCSKNDETLGQEDNHNSSTVVDADGNVYHTVIIGTQTWLIENLKTTKFNDGTSIPNITDNTEWTNLTTPGFCWYNNDVATNKNLYGALYNWYAVSTGNLAPKGWHVPTDVEWTTLEDYVSSHLGNSISVAKALASKTGWNTSNEIGLIGFDMEKNNSSGFSALPGGSRIGGGDIGQFYAKMNNGIWWSSTGYNTYRAWLRELLSGLNYLRTDGYNYFKQQGASVRCIRDS